MKLKLQFFVLAELNLLYFSVPAEPNQLEQILIHDIIIYLCLIF